MVDRERQPLDPDLDAARRVAFCLCLAERQLGITIQPDVGEAATVKTGAGTGLEGVAGEPSRNDRVAELTCAEKRAGSAGLKGFSFVMSCMPSEPGTRPHRAMDQACCRAPASRSVRIALSA
jgi:hypothetical protein